MRRDRDPKRGANSMYDSLLSERGRWVDSQSLEESIDDGIDGNDLRHYYDQLVARGLPVEHKLEDDEDWYRWKR